LFLLQILNNKPENPNSPGGEQEEEFVENVKSPARSMRVSTGDHFYI
jgi:hypothetical protein